MLDIFCSNALVSKACVAIGLPSCAIGYYNPIHSSPFISLDLVVEWAQQSLLRLTKCKHSRPILWIAPPCNTLSFARERRLPAWTGLSDAAGAKPLRSKDHLNGLPSAMRDHKQATKLYRANFLLSFTFQMLQTANLQTSPWFVLNPRNSYLWQFPEWASLSWTDVDLDSCAYGGSRKMRQRIRCSVNWLASLAASCQNDHPHSKFALKSSSGNFAGFATKQEDVLPPRLCAEIAGILKTHVDVSAPLPKESEARAALCYVQSTLQEVDENKKRVALLAAAAGRQARGRRLDALVPEYHSKEWIEVKPALASQLSKRQRLKEGFLLNKRLKGRETQVLEVGEGLDSACSARVQLGVAWSPNEFVGEAKRCEHPFSSTEVPDEVAKAIFACLTEGPEEIRRKQTEFRLKWEKKAQDLAADEATFCEQLHPDVAPFAAKKKPLLLTAILDDLGFGATDVLLNCLGRGFPMFGPFPATGIFPQRSHRASINVDDLPSVAKWARPAMAHSTPAFLKSPSKKEGELNDELWRLTLEEIRLEECRGPFTEEDLDKKYPAGWLGCPRFGVSQKGKVRPCDNYSIYGHNASSDTSETVDTDGPDAILSCAKLWVSSLRAGGEVFVRLRDGSALRGKLHKSLTAEEVEKLQARLVDLKRAYKQLARRPEDAPFAIFGLPRRDGSWAFFEALALGFGARNAVNGFNLPARALRFILNTGLLIPTTHFFDDFSHIEPSAFSDSNSEMVEWLFTLLGWEYKSAPGDLLPSASCFSPLGVEIDFSHGGWAVVSNTKKRRQKILDECERLRVAELVPFADIESLLGVCQFMETQTSGRSGSLLLRLVRAAASRLKSQGLDELRKQISDLAAHVKAAVPRWVRLRRRAPPVLIFTDAAADPGRTSLGGVLVDPEHGTFEFFGCLVSDATVQVWESEGKEQVICQAELLAVPVALKTWQAILEDRDVLVFVDNDPAKDALVRGLSSSPASSRIVKDTRLLCASLAIGAWYDRVASPSNIADGPSRGKFADLVKAGALRVAPTAPCFQDPIGLLPLEGKM